MKDKLINAIVSGDTKKLNEIVREQKGEVYVIENAKPLHRQSKRRDCF